VIKNIKQEFALININDAIKLLNEIDLSHMDTRDDLENAIDYVNEWIIDKFPELDPNLNNPPNLDYKHCNNCIKNGNN
jgi:hypothetical protein